MQLNLKSQWFVLLCLLLYSGSIKAKASSIPKVIRVYGSEAVFDFRLNHTLALVKAALDVNSDKLGPIEVRSTGEADLWMTRNRAIASIQKGKDSIHVISSFASRELDDKLLPIRISIAASVLGERIFLIRPENRQKFDAIASLDDLKKYTIGVGQGWVDGDIMQKAGLRIQTSVRYELLFTMLQGQRFDLLTRAVHEGWDELRTRGFRDMDWTTNWALSYPAPYYLYVNKNEKELALRLQKGLQVLEANGTMDRLFIEHFGPSILRAGWVNRKRIMIKNPFLPRETPLGFSNWDEWHKKAEADLIRMSRLAQERFRPEWLGTYRPHRLIEQRMSIAPNRGPKPNIPPLVVRAADRPNDTHILAAIFALELSLAQPVNDKSPYYRSPVQYLIDKSLDQKKALESLNELNPFIDVVATQTSMEREKRYVNAPVDIAQGLMGRRVFIVRKKNLQQFKHVRTVEDLRKFRICVGMDWPDRQVLESAGIPTLARVYTSELFNELQRDQCHGITRAVYEVRDELLARPLDDLDVDPYLLVSYPAAQHLFFARNKSDLALAAERGLLSLKSQGVLHELLEVIYGDSLEHVQVRGRRVIPLVNPNAPLRASSEGVDLQEVLWLR